MGVEGGGEIEILVMLVDVVMALVLGGTCTHTIKSRPAKPSTHPEVFL